MQEFYKNNKIFDSHAIRAFHLDWLYAKNIINEKSYYKYLFQSHCIGDIQDRQYDILNNDGDIIYSTTTEKDLETFRFQNNMYLIVSENGEILFHKNIEEYERGEEDYER